MSYRNLEIWKMSRELAVRIHEMSLHSLPGFELYEEGSQIRRSMKSVCSNLVEGYGRRDYKRDFIRFQTYAMASCLETIDHLEILYETGSLKDPEIYREVSAKLDELGRKINCFIQSVEKKHQSTK
ncbi:MAG TPA: four helix bundle protein [Verrucomicrobiales bacterium]|nr:four helix bundle protein [Verrucomicrobiales bacterium]